MLINQKITFLRRKDVERLVGLGRSSIYKMVADGKFPKQVRIGSRAVAWRSDEIEQWIQEKLSESEEGNNYEKLV